MRIAYETFGTLNAAGDNAVLVLHALTGDSHVVGDPAPGHPTAGWWSGIVGAGKAIDTDEWFVVAPNMLGGCQGSTGPASTAPDGTEWGARFPFVTIRDQVAAQAAFSDAIGISTLGGCHRRLDGRDAGARVGDHATRSGSSASASSRRPSRATPTRSR